MASTIDCRPGQEEPLDESPLVGWFGVKALKGLRWEGDPSYSDCAISNQEPLLIGLNCAALMTEQDSVRSELAPVLRVSLSNALNNPSGTIELRLVHYDLVVNTFNIPVRGTTFYAPESKSITLELEASGIAKVGSQSILLTFFRAEQLETSLSGTMKVRLTSSDRTETTDLGLAFDLKEIY